MGVKKASIIASISLVIIVILAYSIKLSIEPQKKVFIDFLSAAETPKEFVLFTLPKTGTHLLRPLLEYLTDLDSVSYWADDVRCSKAYLYNKKTLDLLLKLPDAVQPYWLHQPVQKDCFVSILDDLQSTSDFLVTHAPYSKEMENIIKQRQAVVFFVIRDPRDWIISIIRHPSVSGVDLFGDPIGDRYFTSLDLDQKIDHILNGTAVYYSALEILNKFMPWINSPVCCFLRFEVLLGPRGSNYTEEEQLKELRKIADALKIDVSDEILLDAFDESFGKGKTFAKGKASSWKDYFKEEHKALFKEKLGKVLIELSYEKDYNW